MARKPKNEVAADQDAEAAEQKPEAAEQKPEAAEQKPEAAEQSQAVDPFAPVGTLEGIQAALEALGDPDELRREIARERHLLHVKHQAMKAQIMAEEGDMDSRTQKMKAEVARRTDRIAALLRQREALAAVPG